MFLEWENNSRKFQNNTIIDVKQISLSHVIRYLVLVTEALWMLIQTLIWLLVNQTFNQMQNGKMIKFFQTKNRNKYIRIKHS